MTTLTVSETVCIQLAPEYAHTPDNPDLIRILRSTIKQLIESAIDTGLKPAELPHSTESGLSMNLSFAAAYNRAIRALARSQGIREGDAALKLLYAALPRADVAAFDTADAHFLNAFTQALQLSSRPHQRIFASAVLDSLQSNKVGFIEAATGVGKTLGTIAALSHLLASEPSSRVAVAVPTIALIRQFADTHRALEHCKQITVPAFRTVVGRNEFVDVGLLRAILDDGAVWTNARGILDWLDGGGAALGHAQILGNAYLIASLQTIDPHFPVEIVRLSINTPEIDPGQLAYRAQFARPDHDDALPYGEIIYCTHAMVAIDIRQRRQRIRSSTEGRTARASIWEQHPSSLASPATSREQRARLIREEFDDLTRLASRMDLGLLPRFDYLVIDEAHLFEENVSRILTKYVSMVQYVHYIEALVQAEVLPKVAAKHAHSALQTLKDSATSEDVDLCRDENIDPRISESLMALAQAVLSRRVSSSLHTHALLESVTYQARQLALAATVASRGYTGLHAMLTFSPVRAYPRVEIGKQTVQNELAFLWETCQGAACVSATLYLRRLDKDSAGYSASILSVHSKLLKEYPAIRPSWTIQPVQGVWLSERLILADGRAWLRPPSRNDNLADDAYITIEDAWHDDVAQALGHIHAQAAGGVLVLLTSYVTTQALALRLAAQGIAIVAATADMTLQEQIAAFTTLRRNGEKALWLAVGAAWTGLDINGQHYGIDDPAHDTLITDLVIPRLPFGVNRSITHRYRMEHRPQVPWELLDVSTRVKQGLGRLVRREGLPSNRRIYVLDARLADPAFTNYLSIIQRLLAVYPLHSFDLDVQASNSIDVRINACQ